LRNPPNNPSLSEFGCNTNTRTFEELTALYSVKMSGVYSGGLVYEYSQEEDRNYGLVKIDSSSSVTDTADYATLKKQLAANQPPSGDGGYKSSGSSSTCPSKSSTWNVTSDALPAIPTGAVAFMTDGAGKGVGLGGSKSSQNAGGESQGTASAGSGAVTAVATGANAASSSKSAASMPLAPFSPQPLCSLAVALAFAGLGALLL
jgi:hypothetical protein